jgi:hypothetical protein
LTAYCSGVHRSLILKSATFLPEKLEEMRATELQVAQIEKQQILEFECQLAAASSKQVITEQSSLLLSTIITMNPMGPLRRPPTGVLEQLKQMNSHYKLGHLLCRSRQASFFFQCCGSVTFLVQIWIRPRIPTSDIRIWILLFSSVTFKKTTQKKLFCLLSNYGTF